MKEARFHRIALLGLCVFSGSQLTQASADESAHLLSVGAGIASPATTTSLTENPAGLTYNNGLDAQFSASSQKSPPAGPWDLGFGGFAGNGSVGGALKVNDQTSTQNSQSSTSMTGGIGFDVGSLNTAFGASCGTSLGSSVSVTCQNFGMIYAPTQSPRLGVQINTAGPTEYGFGVADEIASNVTLALDSSAQSGGVGMKPGIAFNLSPLQFAFGDGFGLSGSNTGLIRTGFSAGVGVSTSRSVQIEAYYNQIVEYYFALDIRF